MSNSQTSYSKSRELTRFYDKLRLCIDELQLLSEEESISLKDDEFIEVPEERLYGKISKAEFDEILEVYEKQQESSNLQNKPVTSDRIIGQSFAKLLYSKIGFHHLGSATHLVKELGIKDYNRESYLGGHSNYIVHEGEDLKGLKKLEDQVLIKKISQNVYLLLARGEHATALAEINRALKLDDKNGNILAARAKYYACLKQHDTAIEDYYMAIKYEADDMVELHKNLSESLFQIGVNYYHQKNYDFALNLFQESLKCDHENENAKLHIGMCRNKQQAKMAFKSNVNQYRG